MARREVWTSTKEDSGETFTLRPIGAGGVDLFTDPTALDPSVLAALENIEISTGTANRRAGALKLAQLAVPGTAGASHTYAATTKYATFTPPLIPTGGWAVSRHFTAVFPGAGKTGWILGARPNGQTFHVLKITISDAGVITVTWRDSGGNDRTVACTAVTDGATVHLLAVYDCVGGTFTVYINGSSSGTPLDGLSATLKPDQTAGVVWTFGVEKETGQAVSANSNFDGKSDGMTLFTLRGKRPASGTATLIETLRRNSGRVWPNPAQDFVLAHYDEDEASGTVMYDRSNQKNHGTYVGTPSVTTPVAMLSAPTHYVGTFETNAGKWNLIGSFGALKYEKFAEAVV